MASIRLNPTSLRRVGVSVSGYISTGNYHLTCDACGTMWTPGASSGGRLPPGWWKCPTDPSHTLDRGPLQNPNTPTQQTVLNALYFADTHYSAPIRLKKQYHSAVTALMLMKLVEFADAQPDHQSYRLTVAGLAYMRDYRPSPLPGLRRLVHITAEK